VLNKLFCPYLLITSSVLSSKIKQLVVVCVCNVIIHLHSTRNIRHNLKTLTGKSLYLHTVE